MSKPMGFLVQIHSDATFSNMISHVLLVLIQTYTFCNFFHDFLHYYRSRTQLSGWFCRYTPWTHRHRSRIDAPVRSALREAISEGPLQAQHLNLLPKSTVHIALPWRKVCQSDGRYFMTWLRDKNLLLCQPKQRQHPRKPIIQNVLSNRFLRPRETDLSLFGSFGDPSTGIGRRPLGNPTLVRSS